MKYLFECPYCGGQTRVVDTYVKGHVKLRKRRCLKCGKVFSTRSTETLHEKNRPDSQ